MACGNALPSLNRVVSSQLITIKVSLNVLIRNTRSFVLIIFVRAMNIERNA